MRITERLQFFDGLLVLAIVAVCPVFLGGLPDLSAPLRGVYWTALVGVAAAFVLLAGPWDVVSTDRGARLIAAVGVGLAYVVIALGSTYGFGILLLAFVTAFWAFFVPLRVSIATVLVCLPVATFVGAALNPQVDARALIVNALLSVLVVVFSLLSVAQVQAAERARREAEKAHQDLQLAQRQLAERSATDERLRIARELHDVVGHQLAGLTLSLETATHLANDRARPYLQAARVSSKELLAEVRNTVTRLRDTPVPLTTLSQLADAEMGIAIHVDDPCALDELPDELRHAATRMVQEALTNAARHGGARDAWIRVEHDEHSVTVVVRDNGAGSPGDVEGNGLRGMRERFAALGGDVVWQTRRGGGFVVQASAPTHPRAAV